jgi:TRAP-type C4-dicarboxylate transport system permease large subunit
MILLVLPFFWPVLMTINGGIYQGAEGSGFGLSTDDLKVWFGILALVVVELGLITPPVGMNVFVISALARHVPMMTIFRGVFPFFLSELLRVTLLLAFPALTLWLPRLLGG